MPRLHEGRQTHIMHNIVAYDAIHFESLGGAETASGIRGPYPVDFRWRRHSADRGDKGEACGRRELLERLTRFRAAGVRGEKRGDTFDERKRGWRSPCRDGSAVFLKEEDLRSLTGIQSQAPSASLPPQAAFITSRRAPLSILHPASRKGRRRRAASIRLVARAVK